MFPAVFNLTDLNGQNGFAINGINQYDQSGWSVSSAGDVNADGIADIIIGTPDANNYAGQSYVVFGSKSGFTTPFNLTSLNGQNGFTINGINADDDYSGYSVSGAGDVNNDGVDDIVIGVWSSSSIPEGYVVFGSKNEFAPSFDLGNIDGNNGFTINNFYELGQGSLQVSAAGDINNDGIDDVILGGGDHAYVVFGQADSGTVSGMIGHPLAWLIAAGVAVIGGGLVWYAKSHGWCCAGKVAHDDTGYTEMTGQ